MSWSLVFYQRIWNIQCQKVSILSGTIENYWLNIIQRPTKHILNFPRDHPSQKWDKASCYSHLNKIQFVASRATPGSTCIKFLSFFFCRFSAQAVFVGFQRKQWPFPISDQYPQRTPVMNWVCQLVGGDDEILSGKDGDFCTKLIFEQKDLRLFRLLLEYNSACNEIGWGWLPEMNSSFTEPALSYIVKIGLLDEENCSEPAA